MTAAKKRECKVCTNSYRLLRDGTLAAHFDYSLRPRRWCPGGVVPANPNLRTRALPIPR